MSKIPEDLKYTKEHEWISVHDDGTATVGITDYAQESLGDITFVELPSIGDSFGAGEVFGVVESVKAASDLYMPAKGEITGINEKLEEAPETVNEDPFGEGWMVKIRLAEPPSLKELLSADEYAGLV